MIMLFRFELGKKSKWSLARCMPTTTRKIIKVEISLSFLISRLDHISLNYSKAIFTFSDLCKSANVRSLSMDFLKLFGYLAKKTA